MGQRSAVHTFAKGAVIGAVVGIVAGILIAPKSGKETQAILKRKTKKWTGNAEDRLFDLDKNLSERIDSLKDAAKDLRGEAYEESHRMITRAEIVKQDLQDAIRRFGKDGSNGSQELLGDAKRLVREGGRVIDRLEKMTREAVSKRTDGGNGEQS